MRVYTNCHSYNMLCELDVSLIMRVFAAFTGVRIKQHETTHRRVHLHADIEEIQMYPEHWLHWKYCPTLSDTHIANILTEEYRNAHVSKPNSNCAPKNHNLSTHTHNMHTHTYMFSGI